VPSLFGGSFGLREIRHLLRRSDISHFAAKYSLTQMWGIALDFAFVLCYNGQCKIIAQCGGATVSFKTLSEENNMPKATEKNILFLHPKCRQWRKMSIGKAEL
jgi:hypothetical protein